MAKDQIREWQDGGSGGNEGQIDLLHIGHVFIFEYGVNGHHRKGGTTNE